MKAYAQIDLNAARENVIRIKNHTGSNVALIAVVKSDAYSHGAVELARAFLEAGADFLAVADTEEAITLREARITSPVMLFNPPLNGEIKTVIAYNLTPVVDSVKTASLLAKESRNTVNIHVEVDTGMGRGGFFPGGILEKLHVITQLPNINLEGIFTHFPSARDDREFTKRQIALFRKLVSQLENNGIRIPHKHSANSSALFEYPESIFNTVRPGLCLYGISPSSSTNMTIPVEPVLELKSKLIQVRKVPPGTPVSYGRTYTAKKTATIGMVASGYSSGYDRRLSNKSDVIVRGRRCPVTGTICMDRFMVDLTGIPQAKTGDEVVLIGKQGSEQITATELAEKANTVPQEIISRLTVRRIYTR